MIAVYMVKVAINQVVHMVAVRNRLMPTARSMDMACIMSTAMVCRSTGVRIGFRHRNHVLIDVAIVGMMQVSVMEVVDMSIMQDGLVPTAGAMDMFM